VRRPSVTQLAVTALALYSLAQQQDLRRLTTLAMLQRSELRWLHDALTSHGVLLGIVPAPLPRPLSIVPPAG
jgi:hypothetical protein